MWPFEKNSTGASEGSAGVNNDKKVDVEFTCIAFRHNGVEYRSADVEKAAAEGNVEALKVIEDLINMKSGIISVTEKGG